MHLGKSEVDHLDIATFIEHQVFRLEVAVDDTLVMQELESEVDASRVEASGG